MSFEDIETQSFSYLKNDSLTVSNLVHGFCDRGLNFAKDKRLVAKDKFLKQFEVSNLFLMQQCHTANVLELSSDKLGNLSQLEDVLNRSEFDAMVIQDDGAFNGSKGALAFGVLTADCLPILGFSRHGVALIHAGWRGLANGIILKALKALALSSGGIIEVLIGPAAGGDRYEVGSEVIAAIGESAVYSQAGEHKAMLDLAATAARQVGNAFPNCVNIFPVNRCTISNDKYFSYRREGDLAGRNLSFIII